MKKWLIIIICALILSIGIHKSNLLFAAYEDMLLRFDILRLQIDQETAFINLLRKRYAGIIAAKNDLRNIIDKEKERIKELRSAKNQEYLYIREKVMEQYLRDYQRLYRKN